MIHAKTFVKAPRPDPPAAPQRQSSPPAPPPTPADFSPPILTAGLPAAGPPPAAGVAGSPSGPAAGPRAGFTAEQRRELAAIHQVLASQEREDILWTLAWAGRTHVTALCRLVGLKNPKSASRYLTPLKQQRLIFGEQQGLHVYYTVNAALVQLARHGDRDVLTVSHPCGVGVTLFGPVATASPPQSAAAMDRVAASDSSD